MRQIPYNDSAAPSHFAFPVEWDGSLVSAVSLTVLDTDATELLAATNITLYTATTLNGAVSRFASSIVLAAGAGDLSPGDSILIEGFTGNEVHRVKAYNSTTKTVELESILENDHDDASAVYGLFGDYNIDTSVVATFVKGMMVTLLWTPTGSGMAITEDAQILGVTLELEGLREEFKTLYPRAYQAFTEPTDKLEEVLKIARRHVRSALMSTPNPVDINNVVGQEGLMDVVMARMAYLWTLNADEQLSDERDVLANEYDSMLGFFKNSVVWADSDHDLIQDDEEVTDHVATFRRSWL